MKTKKYLRECVKWLSSVMREKHKILAWIRENCFFPAWFREMTCMRDAWNPDMTTQINFPGQYAPCISEEMFKKYCSMFDDPLESSSSTQMKTTYTKSKTLFRRQKQCVLLLLNESNVTIMHGVQTTNYSSECEWVLPLWCFSLENPIPVKTMYLNHIKMF